MSLDDRVTDYGSRVIEKQSVYLEAMAAVYLKFTSLPPDRVVLCQQFKDDVTRFWFEERRDEGLT